MQRSKKQLTDSVRMADTDLFVANPDEISCRIV